MKSSISFNLSSSEYSFRAWDMVVLLKVEKEMVWAKPRFRAMTFQSAVKPVSLTCRSSGKNPVKLGEGQLEVIWAVLLLPQGTRYKPWEPFRSNERE